MAEKAAQTPYVPGGSAAAVAANTEYQKALEDMLGTLDQRKNRLFDPTLLAMAKGFGAPNPSFFGSLGNAAGEIERSQLEQEKEAREIAQAKLGLAGQKMGLLRQQESDAMLEQFLKNKARPGFQSVGATGAPGALGALSAPGAAGAPSAAPTGPKGIKIAPGSPSIVDPVEFIAIARRMDPNASMPDLINKADEMMRRQTRTTEKGTQNLETGEFFPAPGSAVVNVALAGVPGRTFPVPEIVSLRLAQAYNDALSDGDWGPYQRLAQNILNGPTAAPTAQPAAPTGGTSAAAPTAAAPTSLSGGMPSVQDIETGQKARETLEVKRAGTAGDQEALQPERAAAARDMYAISQRVKKNIGLSGEFIGILDKAGVMPALGKILAGGFNTGSGGTFNVAEFENALRNMNKNITDDDIARVGMIARDLNDLELQYTRQYLKGQGSVTEAERAVVRRLSGSIAENPKTILAKMKLIEMRSQFDIDYDDAWNKYIEKNPQGDWTKFQRTIGRDMTNQYNQQLARAFGISKAAVPSSVRREGTQKAQEIVDGLINRK